MNPENISETIQSNYIEYAAPTQQIQNLYFLNLIYLKRIFKEKRKIDSLKGNQTNKQINKLRWQFNRLIYFEKKYKIYYKIHTIIFYIFQHIKKFKYKIMKKQFIMLESAIFVYI
ncbi:hypothetical protein TTHERM_001379991 (macronuclear) [Tetrahymena thermophila SB210]|uniref:Uncharacterized protein n=1 Tax=Tetrahymena thermophila (strain SB210) TaxID=312017 RepID=W7XA93_TETTS|nr:hypothetical protein TTHERM_001379991 [Tetrahymena thermophila SB210]EWS74277.1 hypothetical protein TTHERM_001379991 [Tetrahymena thermophila SB210]|eukprot:XP_012653192.1 hypothetical protein TTHERM_001379991 [Tetrahymena thermophila SB210]